MISDSNLDMPKLRVKNHILKLSLIGANQVYGKWKTTNERIKRASSDYIKCICECGLEKFVLIYDLLRGASSQCMSCATKERNLKHGQNCHDKITYEYRNWQNLKHKKILCAEWTRDFSLFFKETGKRPQPEYILLRKNNKNNHSLSNSFWGHRRLKFYKDLHGKKIGEWLIIEPALDRKLICWLVECSCGRRDHITQDTLMNGVSTKCKSCAAPKPIKHGYHKTSIYNCYHSIKGRCYNKKEKAYPHYGGRGIIMCQRWLDSFENFVKDMGEKPEGTSIDRIDVNGNYSPENCKWSTQKEQVSNRRKTKIMQDEIDSLKERLRKYEKD